MRNLDGSARAHQQVYLDEFVSRSNHCGVSMRFDDFAAPGSHTSDANGRIQFLVPLHELDLQSPYQLRRPGERGIWATNERLQIGAGASQVIQQRWIDAGERSQLPNTEKKYDFTLLDEAGRGVADLTVIAWDAIDSCGIPSHPVSMPSDSAGLATATFAMPETEFIYLAKDVDAEEIYRLSEADIEILESAGETYAAIAHQKPLETQVSWVRNDRGCCVYKHFG